MAPGAAAAMGKAWPCEIGTGPVPAGPLLWVVFSGPRVVTCFFMWVFDAIPSGLTAELRLTVKSLVWTCLHGRYGRCRGAGTPGGPHRRVAARRRERPPSGAAVRVASTPLADHRRRRRGRRCGH